ncbi:MAG: N-acetyltransferase [Actinomycetota bacterium]|nr:N-acetyltransferase [Actinomycetota bacterium]
MSSSGDDVAAQPIACRTERVEDCDRVTEIVRRAFDDQRVVDLVAALRASPDWVADLSLLASVDDEPVAFIAFSKGLVDAPRRLVDVLVLSPVAVLPAFQGRGVATALIWHGIAVARHRQEPLVFVEGDPGFYARFGFMPAGDLGFRRPSLRIPPAAFQILALKAPTPSLTGTLVYPRAFWDHDCVGLRDGS